MRFMDNVSSGSGFATASKAFAAQSDTLTLEFKFHASANWCRFFLLSGTTVAVEIYTNNGNIIYRDYTGTDYIIAPYRQHTWNTMKIVANSSEGIMLVQVNDRSEYGEFRATVSSVDGVLFGSGGSSTGSNYVNDVLITQGGTLIGQGHDVFGDGFEQDTAGGVPTYWTRTTPPGTTCTVETFPGTTNKVMRFTDSVSSSTGYATAQRTFTPLEARFTLQFKFYANANWCRFFLLSGSTVAVEIYTNGNNLVYRNGAGADVVIGQYNRNAWNFVEITVDPRTDVMERVAINGISRVSGAGLRNPVDYVNAVLFGSGGSSTGTNYIDDVIVSHDFPQVEPMNILLWDRFENSPTGSAPADWTSSTPTGTTCTVQLDPASQDKAMRFTDSVNPGYATATRAFYDGQAKRVVTLAFSFYANANWCRFFLLSGSTVAVEMYTKNGSLIYRNAAGADVVIAPYQPNTWTNVTVLADANTDTMDVWVNGNPTVTDAGFRAPVANMNSVLFGSGGSSTGTNYVDDVIAYADWTEL